MRILPFSLVLFSLIVLLATTSCEKAIIYDPQETLQSYYEESVALIEPSITGDSIKRFQLKVGDFALAYPEVTDEPLYQQIWENIRQARLHVILIDDSWGDDITIQF